MLYIHLVALIAGYLKMIAATPAKSKPSDVNLEQTFKGVSETSKIDLRRSRAAYRPLELSPTPSIFARNYQRNAVDFTGFFVLFWVAVSIMIFMSFLENFELTGRPVVGTIFKYFQSNLLDLAKADLAMSSMFLLAFPFQKIFALGYLRWYGLGVYLYSILILLFLSHCVLRCCLSNWSWTHRAMFILHSMVILMKLHSYNVVNGWYSYCYHSLNKLQSKKTDLDDDERSSVEFYEHCLNHHGNTYPENLTIPNALDFLFMPSLCYQLYYPRTAHVRIHYLIECALGTFGCIFLLVIISDHFMVPVLAKAIRTIIEAPEDASATYFAIRLGHTVAFLMFPFMLSFLLVFWVIFEGVCNFSAEITRFADRNFYDDWWNCWTWDQFARTWNKPVHYFLLRHVYVPLNSFMSKSLSTFFTFFVSSVLHELVMGCITLKIRGYGLFFQMTQIPYIIIQRQKFVRRHRLLGNIAFWFSIIIGIALIAALYILF